MLRFVKTLISQLEKKRTYTEFEKVYKVTSNEAAALDLEFPARSRAKKILKIMEHQQYLMPNNSPKKYFEVLDLMIKQLKEGLKTLIRLENVLMDVLHEKHIPE